MKEINEQLMIINVQPRASRAKPHPNKVFMLCYRPRIICY